MGEILLVSHTWSYYAVPWNLFDDTHNLNLCCIYGNVKGTWCTTTRFIEPLIISAVPYNYTSLKFHDLKTNLIQLQIQGLLITVMVMAAKRASCSRKIFWRNSEKNVQFVDDLFVYFCIFCELLILNKDIESIKLNCWRQT